MAIEALKSSPEEQFQHHAGHDLESLLHTMITICHYTVGPGGKLREPKPENEAKKIKLNEWFTTADRMGLASVKMLTLEAFDTFIEKHVPTYWQDFTPFLKRLIDATWNSKPFIEAHNVATHKAYRDILKEALAKYTLEEKTPLAVYAFVPKAKRPNPTNNSSLRQSKRQRPNNVEGSSSELELLPRRPVSQYLENYRESVETSVQEEDDVDGELDLDE